MSSESISPKAFYAKRGFGYSRWETIPENPFVNSILLYDHKGTFSRPMCDVEDHPLLFEVNLEEEKLTKVGNGLYFYDRTIYLSPSTTKIIFLSQRDKEITLSMSESSLETKMVTLYQNQILVEDVTQETYNCHIKDELCVLNEEEIGRDQRINKLKGMLYGYYIGSVLSLDSEKVKRLNVLREIHNIFAAVLSSFDKRPTIYQNERLDSLFEILDEENPIRQELKIITPDEVQYKKMIGFLKKYYGGLRTENDKEKFLCFLSTNADEDSENQAISWIKNRIFEYENKLKNERKLLSADSGELVIVDEKVETVSKVCDVWGGPIVKAWLNNELLQNLYDGKISVYREDLAKNVTLRAKEIIADQWENSCCKKRLNDLRHFIAGESIDLEWGNDYLSSISAVFISGDSWEKLLSFMQGKNMTDYSLAFAFFGELNGFANLFRDFVDVVYDFKGKNGKDLWNLYREFHGQLFGETLSDRMEENCDKKDLVYGIQSKINSFPSNGALSSISKCGDFAEVAEHQQRTIPDCLKIMFDSEKFQQFPIDIQEFYKKGSLKLWKGKNDKSFHAELENLSDGCPKAKTKTKWKSCIKLLSSDAKKKVQEQPSTYSPQEMSPIGDFFYCDYNVCNHLIPWLPKKSIKQFLDDLKWFQDNYKEKYYDEKKKCIVFGMYKDSPKDNRSSINHFKEYCDSKKNTKTSRNGKDMLWLCEIYEKIDLNTIVNKLEELYNVKQ